LRFLFCQIYSFFALFSGACFGFLSAKFACYRLNLRASTFVAVNLHPAFTRSHFGAVNLQLVSGCRLTPFYLGNLTAFVAALCLPPDYAFAWRNLYDIRRLCLSLTACPFTTTNKFSSRVFSIKPAYA